MTAATVASPGTKRLSEVARHVVQPADIVSTDWPGVRRTCRSKLGISFDGWQDGAGKLMLARRADGQLAATVGGVGMSVCRQTGKTYLLTGLIFGLCLNQPGLLVIWSAHHARTHGETFLSMQAFSQRAKVRPHISKVFLGSGDEEIRFRNGSRILFGARERGFGRGIAGVDVLVMDEAQILSDRALQNQLATMNTSRLGLHLYVGTPPKPEDTSEAFTRMREDALSGDAEDVVWIEFSADENADPDDRRQWVKANPSIPHRTPFESIQRLRKKLDPDGFRREALGVWDSPDVAVLDVARWASLADRDAPAPGRVVLAVDVAPDRRWSCIAAAGESNGKTMVMCHSGRGTHWVAGKVAELVATRDVDEVSVFTGGMARVVQSDLVAAEIEYVKMTTSDMAAAAGAFLQAVKSGTILHVGQGELDAAVANAKTRKIGEAEVWDRRDPKTDISPLVAASAAAWRWHMAKVPTPAIY